MIQQTLLGSSVFLALALSAVSAVTQTFKETHTLPSSGSISLQNVNGRIEVLAWDRDEVVIEAVKSADDADKLEKTHIQVDATADALVITTRYEPTGWRFWSTNNTAVHYTVRVPEKLAVARIHGINSSIEVTGLQGRLHLTTVNGRIVTTGSMDAIEARTVNGTTQLAFAALPASGTILAESVNGPCRVEVPKNSVYQLDARTVHGPVTCEPTTKSDKSMAESSGPAFGPMIRLRSVNGGVSLSSRDPSPKKHARL